MLGICIGLLGDTSSAAQPWPYSVAAAPDLPFEPLPLPDAGSALTGTPTPAGAPGAASNSVLFPGPESTIAGACGPIDTGCPGYRLYATFDALFMARYSGIASRPLAFNENTGATVLGTQSLQWGFVPGVRTFFGERKPGGCGWEVGYLGLYGMNTSAQVFGAGNLIAPGDVGTNAPQFNSADLMNVNYLSTLNMAEANIFWYDCCGTNPCQSGCKDNACEPSCGSCRCIDWLAGFRWAGLNESANFNSTCCGLTETSVYGVRTTSNLFGGQVGVRARQDYAHWACEGWLKVGLAGVWMGQTQAPIIDFASGLPYRDGSNSSASAMTGFADANASAIYKINRTWGLRAGINAIWLGNMALAPNQWDFSQTSSVNSINPGSLLLLGANVGAEARW